MTAAIPKTKIMTVAEIERTYPDEWVVIEVVRDARRHESVRGRLIAHDADRYRIHEAEMAFRTGNPGVVTYNFHTTRTIPEGIAVVL